MEDYPDKASFDQAFPNVAYSDLNKRWLVNTQHNNGEPYSYITAYNPKRPIGKETNPYFKRSLGSVPYDVIELDPWNVALQTIVNNNQKQFIKADTESHKNFPELYEHINTTPVRYNQLTNDMVPSLVTRPDGWLDKMIAEEEQKRFEELRRNNSTSVVSRRRVNPININNANLYRGSIDVGYNNVWTRNIDKYIDHLIELIRRSEGNQIASQIDRDSLKRKYIAQSNRVKHGNYNVGPHGASFRYGNNTSETEWYGFRDGFHVNSYLLDKAGSDINRLLIKNKVKPNLLRTSIQDPNLYVSAVTDSVPMFGRLNYIIENPDSNNARLKSINPEVNEYTYRGINSAKYKISYDTFRDSIRKLFKVTIPEAWEYSCPTVGEIADRLRCGADRAKKIYKEIIEYHRTKKKNINTGTLK